MKTISSILFVGTIILTAIYFTSSEKIKTSAASKKPAAEKPAYGQVPLSFEPNAGQTDEQVKFLSRGPGYALFLTEAEAVMRLKATNCPAEEKNCENRSGVLRIGFDGANRQPLMSGVNEQAGKSNYLNLDGTGKAITGVTNYERVQYREIYAGVDLVFYGNERQLEYDFNVAPYADPSQIKLNFNGADNLSIDANGDLIAKLAGKDVKFSAPVAYQNVNGERRAVAAEYLVTERTKIAFVLGEYDDAETLVIDPILEYASYLGGSTNDSANAIVVNAAGEAYVAGETSSPNFPIVNAIQPNKFDTTDAFLTKFNASGSGVVFSTYLGGTGVQAINNLALDANNNIAIAGIDQRNNFDAFVGKLNAAGNALVYPTVFRGGNGEDGASGVAVDASGNAYITGITESTNFPTTPGVIQVNDGPGAGAFAVRVNANGAIAYSTYLDGAEDNFGNDIAVDGAGNAYIVGEHGSLPNSSGFILKLNPTGSGFGYPTFYFGGSNREMPADVEIDGSGNAYIGGDTTSSDFPVTAGVIQPTRGGGYDGFVAKVNSAGNGLVWASYLGGISDESVVALALDSGGGIYVTGNHRLTGDSNYYVAHLNSTASALDYNAQFGGRVNGEGSGVGGDDYVYALAVDPNDNVYVSGFTVVNDFPTTAGAFDRTFNGSEEGFVMKIAAPENGGSTVMNVNVPGNSVLNNEKLVVQLNAGDQVTIDNISGQVNFDAIDVVPGCTYIVNANGLDRGVYNTNQVGCYNNEWTANDPLTGANQGHAGLYMMRGAAKTFIGLNGATFTASTAQTLYLGVNDVPTTGGPDGGAPNTGSFNARVTITPGSSQTIVTNVTVAGTNVGVNGGVTNPQVTIQPNDFVKIEAIGGIVNFNTHATKTICQPVAYEVGPLGRPRPDLFDEGNPCYDGERIDCQVNTLDPMPSRNHAGLFRPSQAGIGGIKWIGAGTDTFTYTGTSNTTLKLGVNDAPCAVSPNSGSFNVRITVVRPSATTLTINVPGNSVPNSEKFVTQLNAGDEVTINNISGQVNFNTQANQTCINSGVVYNVNANGLLRSTFTDPSQSLCYDEPGTDPLTSASAGHAGLYMMRGATKTFIGLNGSTFTAAAGQALYLGVNDSSGAGSARPNSGSFNAAVTITRAATVEPTLSVNTVTLQEGNAGTTNAVFTVSLSPAADETVTVRYQTADGTAIAGQDYTATGNTLTFAPGETSKTVTVPIIGDLSDEPDEYFTLQLINPAGAQTVFPRGRANITDDDAVPSISVTDATVTEGNSGTVNANFAVSLSGLSGNTVTVNFATANGTAAAPGDYTARSESLTFAPGETSKLVSIAVVGDTLVEANETFSLNLSGAVNATIADASGLGTITNDDIGGSIQFSTAAVSVNEGAGTVILTVNRTGGAASGVTVNYATQNGTATAGQDYTTTNGVLTFGAGEASKPIIVPITNDTNVEGNETFTVNLSSPAGGATLGSPASVTVTIVDNDTCSYSISPGSQNFAVGGGTGSINVTAPAGCGWTATESAAWITITGGASGSGNGTVSFTVAANTSAARNDTITAAGQAFAVTQAGATPARRVADFDGDGKSDVSVFRPSTAVWHLNQSTNGYTGVAFGLSTDKLAAADYDGDGKTDIGVFRPSTGTWYLLRSTLGFTGIAFGQNGDIPAPADYDGDGKADLAVFRPSNGTWYLLRSTLGSTGIAFGQSGDIPVAGDYDDDGKSDVAVFRTGVWYILRSTLGFTGTQFGSPGDKPVVGDYDGDRKADLTVYRPSSGTWYLLRSTAGFTGIQFGIAEDIPVEGDYDGDAKSDLGVFRPSTSTWYLLRSTAGLTGVTFGANGDLPVPSKAGS